jgi:1-acyl-sn-glycerol-3-phosphate acyltransferase
VVVISLPTDVARSATVPDRGTDAEVLAFTGVPPVRDEPGSAFDSLAAAASVLYARLHGPAEAVDEFGFDPALADSVILPAVRALYEKWFRVEVSGIEHVPARGGALLVANHGGGLAPWDAAMTAVAVHVEHPAHRWLRPLGANLVFETPGLRRVARRAGATLACAADADRLLRAGELVGVWPEGFRGTGKPFRQRYQLQRFGRGGFVRAALTAGVPIVPVSIVGAEEVHPVLGTAGPLARLLRLPYFPLTPTFPWFGPLGLVPLPSKWLIEFGAPVYPDGRSADDAEAVAALAAQVRETIQDTLPQLLARRRSVWR